MDIRLIAGSRLVIVLGLAMWLSIAVLNNLSDPGTNRQLLGHMFSMDLLRGEPVLGAGLLWRAWPAHWAVTGLYLVSAAQALCAALLWRAAASYIQAFWREDPQVLAQARQRAMLGLSLFVLLWLVFICGGLWFGYWLKQGAAQMVHLTLILIGIGAQILVQAQPSAEWSPVSGCDAQACQPVCMHEGPLAPLGDSP